MEFLVFVLLLSFLLVVGDCWQLLFAIGDRNWQFYCFVIIPTTSYHLIPPHTFAFDNDTSPLLCVNFFPRAQDLSILVPRIAIFVLWLRCETFAPSMICCQRYTSRCWLTWKVRDVAGVDVTVVGPFETSIERTLDQNMRGWRQETGRFEAIITLHDSEEANLPMSLVNLVNLEDAVHLASASASGVEELSRGMLVLADGMHAATSKEVTASERGVVRNRSLRFGDTSICQTHRTVHTFPSTYFRLSLHYIYICIYICIYILL